MQKRVEFALEVRFPVDQMEMRAAAAELEAQLDRESWACVEALALAILAQDSPAVAMAWDAIHRAE